MTADPLPRLLVLADFSVVRTGTNPLLLYRILRDYPCDRLRVIHTSGESQTDSSLRLPGVEYHQLELGLTRFVHNRFNRPLWPLSLARKAARMSDQVLDLIGDFRPDAVVGVANGYLWFTADAIGRKRGIPFHLFLHEDWPYLVSRNRPGLVWQWVQRAARRMARPVIRRAATRFSVSPGMAEETARTYGVESEVLYPNRGDDSPTPRVRVRPSGSGSPVVAHCGYVHRPGNATLLREVARMVGADGGRLDLYTQHNDDQLAHHGLVPPISHRVGFFPAAEMGDRLGATAHSLFLSAAFDPVEQVNESTLFPSKLADYTAVGLPIIIWGPAYSSAARWATENPGATVLFTDPDPRPVGEAVRRLAADPAFAAQVAAAGIEAGMKYFELKIAQAQFYRAVLRHATESTPES